MAETVRLTDKQNRYLDDMLATGRIVLNRNSDQDYLVAANRALELFDQLVRARPRPTGDGG